MYQPHPTMQFKITEDITGVLTQSQRGITHLTFVDTEGKLLRIPRGLKCYDKSARSLTGDPLGHLMNTTPHSISLCMTNGYEVYWNGKLTTELNFTWYITSHYDAV